MKSNTRFTMVWKTVESREKFKEYILSHGGVKPDGEKVRNIMYNGILFPIHCLELDCYLIEQVHFLIKPLIRDFFLENPEED